MKVMNLFLAEVTVLLMSFFTCFNFSSLNLVLKDSRLEDSSYESELFGLSLSSLGSGSVQGIHRSKSHLRQPYI
jgi:hypothetical protein